MSIDRIVAQGVKEELKKPKTIQGRLPISAVVWRDLAEEAARSLLAKARHVHDETGLLYFAARMRRR